RPAELLAHLRVLDRHLERPRGAAQAVGGDAERAEVEQAGEERPARALAPEERRALEGDVTEVDLAHAARESDGLCGPHAHAGGPRSRQEARHGAPPR